MQKITPFLWFEKNIKEIVDFYVTTFPEAHIKNNTKIENTPSGQAQMCTLEIFGVQINLMTAGPYLPFNPTISFIVSCDSEQELTDLWDTLEATGKVLMNLDSYPFAEKYGWVQDKYGVSWQLMYSSTQKPPQKILPTLMFAGDMCGKAQQAIDFYTSVFKNSHTNYISKYGEDDDEQIETNGVIKHAGITIEDFYIALMDSGKKSPLTFQQAISFVIHCTDQTEIDYYWEKLTSGGTEIQCGWLTDMFGVPWQVVPIAMEKMLSKGNKEQVARVTEAFMKMKKFDIKALEQAFDKK